MSDDITDLVGAAATSQQAAGGSSDGAGGDQGAASGAAGAAAAAPGAKAAEGAQGASEASWGELADEQSEYLRNKGWQTPADALASYANLEKLVGDKSERVKPLGEDATDEERAQYRKVMGVPDEADGYNLIEHLTAAAGDRAKELGDLSQDPVVQGAGELFHKHNIGGDAARELAEWFVDTSLNAREGFSEAAAETRNAEVTAWRKAEKPERWEAAQTVVRGLGLDAEKMTALLSGSPSVALDVLARIGGRMQEGGVPGLEGDGFSGGNKQAMAQAELERLMKPGTDSARKYISGDADMRAKVDRLHREAAGVE